MDLRKMRHAVVLSRVLSFTKAADRLQLTQSALSQSIKTLEQEYGVQLFDRSRSQVQLTSVGRKFVSQAPRLLRDGASLEAILHQAARTESGDIAIGLSPLPTRLFLSALLTGMMDAPNLRVEVMVGNPHELLAALLEEKIELCICSNQRISSDAPVTGVRIGTRPYPFAPVVRAGHPLAGRGAVSFEALQDYPFVSSSKWDVATAYPATMPELNRDRPGIAVENYEVLLDVTRNSDAVWVTAPQAIAKELAAGELTIIETHPALEIAPIAIKAFHLKNRYLSPTAKRAIERLQRLSQDISAPDKGKR